MVLKEDRLIELQKELIENIKEYSIFLDNSYHVVNNQVFYHPICDFDKLKEKGSQKIFESEIRFTRAAIEFFNVNGFSKNEKILKKMLMPFLKIKDNIDSGYFSYNTSNFEYIYNNHFIDNFKVKNKNDLHKTLCYDGYYKKGELFIYYLLDLLSSKKKEKMSFFKNNPFIFLRLLILKYINLNYYFKEKEILEILNKIPNHVLKLDMSHKNIHYNKNGLLKNKPKLKKALLSKVRKDNLIEILNDASEYNYYMENPDSLKCILDDKNNEKIIRSYFFLFFLFTEELSNSDYTENPCFKNLYYGNFERKSYFFKVKKEKNNNFKIIINNENFHAIIDEKDMSLSEKYFDNYFRMSEDHLNMIFTETKYSYIEHFKDLISEKATINVELEESKVFRKNQKSSLLSYDYNEVLLEIRKTLKQAERKKQLSGAFSKSLEGLLFIFFVPAVMMLYVFDILDTFDSSIENRNKIKDVYDFIERGNKHVK